ncbi:MAG: YdcF family protein, partial [Planctomycetota bacterium]|nr:YdcF family protein [Planctomycetota bacterium]
MGTGGAAGKLRIPLHGVAAANNLGRRLRGERSVFLLKKIVAPLLFPLPICLLCLLAAAFLCWRGRVKSGRWLLAAGTAMLALMCFAGLPEAAVRSLELRYPPLTAPLPAAEAERIKWIVVLGGGVVSHPDLPALSRLTSQTRSRLLEGVRLLAFFPGARLLLSGGRVFEPESEAAVMAAAAAEIGVPAEKIAIEEIGRDTAEEARAVAATIGSDACALVTSAVHMPRAMREFAAAGLHPLPAPCDYLALPNAAWSPADFQPRASRAYLLECAAYEYIG